MENIQVIQTNDGSSSLLNVALNETYHSRHGAIQESNHVFIRNGLQFFAEKKLPTAISVFEVGFGTGLNALLALHYSEEHKIKIEYTSLEAFPIGWEVASNLNYPNLLNIKKAHHYFQQLHQMAWNEKAPVIEGFSLLKIKTDIQVFEFQSNQFDVIFFDAFAPAKQPEMWVRSIFEVLFYAMKSGGVFATYCARGQLKRDLKSLGMAVESLPGPPGKREMVRAIKQ